MTWTAVKGRVVAGLLAFVLLETLLILYVDKPLSQLLRQFGDKVPALLGVFRVITYAGIGAWYEWPSGIGLLICLIVVYGRWGSESTRARFQRLLWPVAAFFISISAAGLLTDLIKPLVGRARPKLLESSGIYGFFPLTFGADWASMPSGHTTTAVAVAIALMSFFPRWRLALAAFAFAAGLSRVMVNAHFLSDVLAGAFIGWCVTALTLTQFRNRNWLRL